MRPVLVVLTVLAAVASPALSRVSPREKRQARIGPISCSVSPSNVDKKETPSKQNEQISVNCPTSDDIESCIIAHTEPMNVNQGSSSTSKEPVGRYQV